jgi:hypothetical protein
MSKQEIHSNDGIGSLSLFLSVAKKEINLRCPKARQWQL